MVIAPHGPRVQVEVASTWAFRSVAFLGGGEVGSCPGNGTGELEPEPEAHTVTEAAGSRPQ